jgi:predicted dehydrogenase
MKIINLALVGIGKFGKKYLNEIYDNKHFNCSYVIKKNHHIKNKKFFLKKKIKVQIFNNNLKLNNIQGAIIASPVYAHYKNAKYFLNRKIPIILEKPAANNHREVFLLNELSKKKKTSVLVHYSDLYNDKLNYLSKYKCKIGRIKKIDVNFFKKQNFYKNENSQPFFDWLPHILAILNKFININGKFKFVKKIYFKKKKAIYQSVVCKCINKENQNITIEYSNIEKKKSRMLKIFGTKGIISYDDYNKKNNFVIIKKKINFFFKKRGTIQNILNNFYFLIKKNSYQNDLIISLKIQKVFDKIKKIYLKN